jgi:tetratricopeptide (TPR) repeat protein
MFSHSSHLPEIPNKLANAVFWFYRYEAQHSEQVYYEALAQLEKAVKSSPDCPLCYAVLAHLYSDGVFYNYITVQDPIGTSQLYINKALALDPNCQHAHIAQAWVHALTGNKEKTAESVRVCYAINPNSSFFAATCSLGYALLGEYDRSMDLHEQAIVLNPLPYWWMSLLKIFLAYKKGNFQEALFHAQKKGTPKVIYEYVLEMIAYYHLKDEKSLKQNLQVYHQKYPGKLDYVSKALPMVIYDQEVKDLVVEAFDHIRSARASTLV